MFDGKAFGEEMAAVCRAYVDEKYAPVLVANEALVSRLDALEKHIANAEKPLELDAIVKAVGEKGPELFNLAIPRDGENGKDADPEVIKQMVAEAVAEIPAPKDGVSPELPDIDAIIGEKVSEAVKSIPVAKDGENGVGLADALIDQDGALVITMTDGRTKALGKVVGKDGEAGQHGETFGLDDFNIVQGADARSFKFLFQKGEVAHSFEFAFPIVLDRGVFTEGKEYEQGDAVTWAGSLWIAQCDTKTKPDTAESGWRLAVKRGRDGKNAT